MTILIRPSSESISHNSSEEVSRKHNDKHDYRQLFHGSHSRKEDRKRLKKLVHKLEKMLEGHDEKADSKPTAKAHQQKMLQNRFKDGMNKVKNQFGLHDEATSPEEHPTSSKGLQKKMLNYRFSSSVKDKFKSTKNSEEKPEGKNYSSQNLASISGEDSAELPLDSAKDNSNPLDTKEKSNTQKQVRGDGKEPVNSALNNENDETVSEEDSHDKGNGSGKKNSNGRSSANLPRSYTEEGLNSKNSSSTEALNASNALVVNSVLSEKEKEKDKKNKDKRGSGYSVKSGSKTSGSGHVNNIVDTDNALAAQGDIVLSGGIAVLYLFMDLLGDLAQYQYLEMQQKAKVSREAQEMANRVNAQIGDLSGQKDPDTATVQLDPDVIKYMEDNNIKVGDKTIDEYLKNKDSTPTNVVLKSADGKYDIDVYKQDNQWYMKSQNQDGSKYGPPQKIDAPTFKDGKVSFTTKDDYTADGVTIPKGTEFNGSYQPEPDTQYRALNKGELGSVKSALENESNRASDFVSQSQLTLQKTMQTYNVTVSLINSMQTLLEEMNKSIAQNIR